MDDWLTANALAGLRAALEADEATEQAAVVSLSIPELEKVIRSTDRLRAAAEEKLAERWGTMAPAWQDLMEGLAMLSRYSTNDEAPLHADHERLIVMASADEFTEAEMKHLESLGFPYDDEHGFHSYRFGSA